MSGPVKQQGHAVESACGARLRKAMESRVGDTFARKAMDKVYEELGISPDEFVPSLYEQAVEYVSRKIIKTLGYDDIKFREELLDIRKRS